MKQTLFEISQDARALDELLEEMDGELSPENEAAFDELNRELEQSQTRKVRACLEVIERRTTMRKAREEKARKLLAFARTDENIERRVKTLLIAYLRSRGLEKLETEDFKLRIQKNGGKNPVVLNEYFERNPQELPERYRKVVFQPDLERLREDLCRIEEDDATTAADEAEHYAHLGDRGEHLRVT